MRPGRSDTAFCRLGVWKLTGWLWLLGNLCVGSAAEYPIRSVQVIVPWAAGGGTDRVARSLADGLQRRLHKPFIVVNRTGGGGAVGHSAGALAPPDGYTLTFATFELGTMNALGIAPLTPTNFTPVALVNADAAAILVRRDAPWKSLQEWLDDVRRHPGRVKMSGTATGGAWDLARAGLLLMAGIAVTNALWIPSQGSAPALVELLGGHVDTVACSAPEASSQLASGDVRALALLGAVRHGEFPEIPTARELGVAYEGGAWRGLMAPRGTPPEIVQSLARTVAEVTDSPEFTGFMRKNGFTTLHRGPTEFSEFLQAEESKWRQVIRGAGMAGVGSNRDPGPYLVPAGLAVAVSLGTLLEFWRSRRQRAAAVNAVVPSPSSDPAGRSAIGLLGALGAYLVLLPWVGFAVSTGLFVTGMLVWLGSGVWRGLLVAGGLVLAIHILFVTLFKVPLP